MGFASIVFIVVNDRDRILMFDNRSECRCSYTPEKQDTKAQ